jgi:hypothetical protein
MLQKFLSLKKNRKGKEQKFSKKSVKNFQSDTEVSLTADVRVLRRRTLTTASPTFLSL